ncbi:sigma-54-dependent Fis family transcriptional regulator [Candidatus Dependentiae bacterium]|nr:sigma-54-dependent Fis family transcriptional regulator [Candidatus Dependentiae bacterium]
MKILIVDDEKLLCESLKQILEFEGMSDITISSNAIEGENEIIKNIYDIVIIDLMMPEKNGNKILSDAKAKGVKSEFIVLTAVNDIPMVVECLKSGAFNYILKPTSKDLMIAAVKSAYEHYLLKNNLALFTTRHDVVLPSEYDKILTNDLNFKKILLYSYRLAKTDCPVFITGSSGTGKTLLAEAIHNASSRKNKTFVSVNINAIPDALFESELFGHRKGAFTGANENKSGLCKIADGGTLFIDEIGELTLQNQIKLLKIIEEKSFYPVGSNVPEKSDFRIITATSKDLIKEVSAGSFRNDLFYRINIGNIYLPNLKERSQDIFYLSKEIIRNLNEMNNTNKQISTGVFNILVEYEFPGNYRELRNIIESAYYKTEEDVITQEFINIPINSETNQFPQEQPLSLEDKKKQYIKSILAIYQDKNIAAKVLKISLRQLYNYINKYKI